MTYPPPPAESSCPKGLTEPDNGRLRYVPGCIRYRRIHPGAAAPLPAPHSPRVKKWAADMLGPDSRLLTALLVTASVAFLVGVVRFRLLPVRVLCGALSVTVAMSGGVAAVNYYYGYYKTWGGLWADFHGGG